MRKGFFCFKLIGIPFHFFWKKLLYCHSSVNYIVHNRERGKFLLFLVSYFHCIFVRSFSNVSASPFSVYVLRPLRLQETIARFRVYQRQVQEVVEARFGQVNRPSERIPYCARMHTGCFQNMKRSASADVGEASRLRIFHPMYPLDFWSGFEVVQTDWVKRCCRDTNLTHLSR
jgi:hypothetical protein